MDILQNVMDSSSHAMFTMDRQGIVTHINQQAKERFGLFNHSLYAHSAGRLAPGDLVILATTAVGADDGNLTPEDLAVESREEAVAVLRRLLDGEGPRPMRDMVALNVGLAIFLMEEGMPLDVCMARAREAVRAGLGRRVLHAA